MDWPLGSAPHARRVLAALFLTAALVGCAGGDSATVVGTVCDEPGATTVHEGVEYLCKPEPDGLARWNVAASITERDEVARIQGTPCTSQGELRDVGSGPAICDTNGTGELIWQDWIDPATVTPSLADVISGGECEDRTPVFVGTIARDVAEIDYVVPLGKVSDKHITPTDHPYVSFVKRGVGDNEIVAPADAVVVGVEPRQENGSGDHALVLELSCDLYMTLGHLDQLVGPLASFDALDFSAGYQRVRISVRAGETIALAGEQMTDWGMYDQRVVLQGLHPLAFVEREPVKVHTVSFYDYIPATDRAALEARSIVSGGDPRGRIDWDVVDTARGNWFEKGTGLAKGPYGDTANTVDIGFNDATGYWDHHLSLAPSFIDPSVTLLAKGLMYPDRAGVLAIEEPVDMSSVRASGAPLAFALVEWRYRSAAGQWDIDRPFAGPISIEKGERVGVLVLQVLPDGLMKAEVRLGSSADTSPTFTDLARVYERD